MKVVLSSEEDVKCINWLAVGEQIANHARQKIADAMLEAGKQLKTLKPGESRHFRIEIGSIEISREPDAEARCEVEIPGKP